MCIVYPARSLYFIPYLVFSSWSLSAQQAALPAQSPGYHILERLEIRSGVANVIHSEVKPYTRGDVAGYALTVAASDSTLTQLDRQDIQYLYDDNTEWIPDSTTGSDAAAPRYRRNSRPLFGIFYRTPANFFEVNTPDFHLRVNPMVQLSAGRENGDAEMIFTNQRGIELRGDIDRRIYFYSNFLETQVRFPAYVNERIDEYRAVPGAGFYKSYQSKLFDIRNGYDYNLANASVGGQITKHIGVQFGHGRHFIGNGYRSLLLSDVGNYAFFLKFSTRIWKLHYQNLFLELNPISTAVPRPANSLLPKKYAAIHYLSLRLNPNLAVGFFEATVFNRSRQFEFQYLNPVILYRTVEGMIGSPDNVLVGFDGHWNLLRRFQLYGQVVIDEFLFSELINPEQKGWWGNKLGWQAGLKYINAFGVDHLDLQIEYNRIRPYTYSSFDSLNSYTHYNQPLAHPLGANFSELIGVARFQPVHRLQLTARLIAAKAGENTDTENWGANPLLSYGSRVQEYGNVIGQGAGASILIAGLDISWALYHNLYLDLNLFFRRKNSEENGRDRNSKIVALGIRMNIWNSSSLDF